MRRLPGKLEPFAGIVNLAFIFDALAGGGLPDDFDILTRAPQRPVEYAVMPGSNRLVGDAEAEQQPPVRQILNCRGLNAERDRAAAIDVVDRGPELQR